MSLCLQPECLTSNPSHYKFCHKCGKKILLGERYRGLKKLGEGGFGVTFSAIDEHRWDTPCVIKQFIPLLTGSDSLNKCIELFKQESKLLKLLGKHPQIPDLLAFFEQETKIYLIQEFIDGQDLLKELHTKGRYSDSEVKDFLLSLLGIIDFIHQQKIYHRDIKLENIIRRQDGVFMLIDFGISKQASKTIATKMSTIAGTASYAPPEQLRGFIHPTSDLYSLAVTAIRMLTGCLPEEKNGSMVDELFDILYMQWVWQEWLNKKGLSVNQDLAVILEKMLSQKVVERFQSAQEVIKALKSPVITLKSSLKTAKLSPNQNNNLKPSSNQISQFQIANKLPNLKTFDFETVTIIGIKVVGREKTGLFGLLTKEIKQAEIKTTRKVAKYITFDLGKGVTLDMVYIPGGTFMMGSPQGEGYDTEKPQHQVTIKSFFIGKYQVTQAQWEVVMRNNPSYFKGRDLPVERVSWQNSVKFCNKLTELVQKNPQNFLPKTSFRLPSEAEWEYACRADTQTPFYFGNTITPDLANYNGNYNYGTGPKGQYRIQTTPVGTFPPNAFGLYDMHGNLWEWCLDNWHRNYEGAPQDGSPWLDTQDNSNMYLLRGGSWYLDSNLCRSAARHGMDEHNDDRYIGFRIVCSS